MFCRHITPMVFVLFLSFGALFAGESGGSVSGFYGSFSTKVPIAAPAYHGLEPNLELVYNSGGGPGWIGKGWSLNGFSFIERAGNDSGAPLYDTTDSFYLDGQELVPDSSRGGEYATRILNYARIIFDSNGNRWITTGSNGNTAVYAARFDTAAGVFRWYLSSVTDPNGNRVDYSYFDDNGLNVYLDTISYNNTVIRFYRESRPDAAIFATGSTWGENRYRLSTIDITVNGNRARAYDLNYRQSAGTGPVGKRHPVWQRRRFERVRSDHGRQFFAAHDLHLAR